MTRPAVAASPAARRRPRDHDAAGGCSQPGCATAAPFTRPPARLGGRRWRDAIRAARLTACIRTAPQAGGAAVRRCQVHALQNPDGDRPASRRSPFSCPPGDGPDNVRRRMQEAQTDPAYIGAAPAPALAATADSGFVTAAGIGVRRVATPFDPALLAGLTQQVDERRGGVLSSGMEYPGRYSRSHVAYVDQCVEIAASGRRLSARALNERGNVLLPAIAAALRRASRPLPGDPLPGSLTPGSLTPGDPTPGDPTPGSALHAIEVIIPEPAGSGTEEERSRRPTVFTALREIIAAFAGPDEHLGLYGAFGHDLAFQFEPVRLSRERDGRQRDLVLHLPDELYVLDRKRETALRYSYEFEVGGASTEGLPRATAGTARR